MLAHDVRRRAELGLRMISAMVGFA